MLGPEIALAVLLLVASVVLAVWLWRLRGEIDDVTSASDRLVVIAAENARLAKSARDVTRAVTGTTAAVEIGTNIVRASHKAIAAIPFDVLESIPATRATSKFVRGIHDGTSAGVYRAIFGVNKAIGNAVRDAMSPRPAVTGPGEVAPVRIDVERLDEVPELLAVTELEPDDPILELEAELPVVPVVDEPIADEPIVVAEPVVVVAEVPIIAEPEDPEENRP